MMESLETVPVENGLRHAEAVLETLLDHGPLTSSEVCQRLGWTKGRFTLAVRVARQELCPNYGVSIPHPVPDDGWRYQVTTEWKPVERGASHAMGAIETRLHSIMRDVRTVKPALDPQSIEGRRANFLDKHLTHILGTLREITGG